VGGGPRGIAVGEGGVWVANSLDGTVARVQPTTNSVTGTIRVGDGPSGIAASEGAVWVANRFGGTLMRIDTTTNAVVETVHLGGLPEASVVVDGTLWITAASSGANHRGGTLTLFSELGIGSIDPAIAYDPYSRQILSVTNDGLLEFERVGGTEGATLVPNLATSLRRPLTAARATPSDSATTSAIPPAAS
jgi:YVTN family beta-propeller protein